MTRGVIGAVAGWTVVTVAAFVIAPKSRGPMYVESDPFVDLGTFLLWNWPMLIGALVGYAAFGLLVWARRRDRQQ